MSFRADAPVSSAPLSPLAQPPSDGVRADGVPMSLARADDEVARTTAARSESAVIGRDAVEDGDGGWLESAIDASKSRAFGAAKKAADLNSAVGVNTWARAATGVEVATRYRHVATRPVDTARNALTAGRAARDTVSVMEAESKLLGTVGDLGHAGAAIGVAGAVATIADECLENGRFTGEAGLALADGAIGVGGTYLGPVASSFSIGWSIGRTLDSATGASDALADAVSKEVKTDLRGTFENVEQKLGSDEDMDALIRRIGNRTATNDDKGAIRTLLTESRLAGVLRRDGSIDAGRARDIMGWRRDDDLVVMIKRAQIAARFLQ